MRASLQTRSNVKGRVFLITVLYALSVAIILLGAGFSIYSMLHGVKFMILSTSIPGAVFGLVILFLGIRYFFSMTKLKDEVYQSAGFSWNNFRKEKSGKA